MSTGGLLLVSVEARPSGEYCRAHQSQRVALLNHTGPQSVIEHDLPVFQMIFEVDIRSAGRQRVRNARESEVMGRYQSDGAALHKTADHGFGADGPVVRVCTMQNFVK